jgi:thiol-disulfide isomerase/thioredoxin
MRLNLKLLKQIFFLSSLGIFFVFSSLWAQTLNAGSEVQEVILTEGQLAPDFQLNDLRNRSFRLYDLLNSGNYVLINFWATWCPPCLQEIPSMEALNQSFKGKPFSLLAISVDENPLDVLNFVNQVGESRLSFLVLLDPLRLVSEGAYGTKKFPETYLIGPNRRVLAKFVGERNWMDPSLIAELKKHFSKKNQ